jgi:hypothetical protein
MERLVLFNVLSGVDMENDVSKINVDYNVYTEQWFMMQGKNSWMMVNNLSNGQQFDQTMVHDPVQDEWLDDG